MQLTVKEAALRACVCESIVIGWIESGNLPHARLDSPGDSGQIVIEVEDLDGLLANFSVEKKEP